MRERPLQGLRILEFAGIGPGPFCGMVLSDLGADVVRIDRPGAVPQGVGAVTGRGRRSVALDLKSEDGRDLALKLIEKADGLFEGYRPGVMERMGLGPDEALARNKRIVYGRMTGWGQTGPLAHAAGHDINYIALSGVLGSMGRPGQPPAPPLNIIGDYAGGAMFLAVGLLAGLLQAQRSGEGHVIDVAMTDGSALLMALFHDLKQFGAWGGERGANLLDGGAPFYDTYQCADANFVSIGPIEPQFFAQLIGKLGLADDPDFAAQLDPGRWPAMKRKLAALFATKTRAQWTELLQGTDACFAPVLSMQEAADHPHNRARETFITVDGQVQPASAPRFRDVPHTPAGPAPASGQHTNEVLNEWGIDG